MDTDTRTGKAIPKSGGGGPTESTPNKLAAGAPAENFTTSNRRMVTRPSVESMAVANQPKGTRDLLATRAFEAYESGPPLRRNLDEWLQTEAEFLHPLHISLSNSPEELSIRAEMPGYREKDLRIEVAPGRVTITGKREKKNRFKTGRITSAEHRSGEVVRVIDLPDAVSVDKVRITLREGILEVGLAKTRPI